MPLDLLAQLPDQIQPFAGTPGGDILPVVQGVINIFLGLVGLAAAVYMALNGIKYFTAGGSEQDAEKAKKGIMYAVIGLIVVGLSAAIVNFTISAVQGTGQFQQQNPLQGLPIR